MALTHRVRQGDPDFHPWTVIGTYVAGDQEIKLHQGLITTVRQAEHELKDRSVLRRYAEITKDSRASVNLYWARIVVLCDMQVEWYKEQDLPIPAKVTNALESSMAKAKAEKSESEGGSTGSKSKAPRITAKSIITQGLLAGKSAEKILAEVHAKVADSKADGTHITYYRSALEKEGKLEKSERPARAKKVKPAAPSSATMDSATGTKGRKSSKKASTSAE